MSGQKGGVDVENALARYLQNLLTQDLAEGHANCGLRVKRGQLGQRWWVAHAVRLVDRQAYLQGGALYGWRSWVTAASSRSVRLRVHRLDIEPIVDEPTQGGDGERGCAQKNDGHDGSPADSSTGRFRNAIQGSRVITVSVCKKSKCPSLVASGSVSGGRSGFCRVGLQRRW